MQPQIPKVSVPPALPCWYLSYLPLPLPSYPYMHVRACVRVCVPFFRVCPAVPPRLSYHLFSRIFYAVVSRKLGVLGVLRQEQGGPGRSAASSLLPSSSPFIVHSAFSFQQSRNATTSTAWLKGSKQWIVAWVWCHA